MDAPSTISGKAYLKSVLVAAGEPEYNPQRTKLLVKRFQAAKTPATRSRYAQIIFEKNVRYGVKIARSTLRSFPHEELPGLLYASLWDALVRYSPEHNTTFCTYWTHWIKKHLYDTARVQEHAPYVLSHHYRGMLARYAKVTSALKHQRASFTDEDVAEAMCVTTAIVQIIREHTIAKSTSLSLHEPYGAYEDSDLQDRLSDTYQRFPDTEWALEQMEQRIERDFVTLLDCFQSTLDLHMLSALLLCHLFNFDQSSVGDMLGHTRERIRQITSESPYIVRFYKIYGVPPALLGSLGKILIAIATYRRTIASLHPLLRCAVPFQEEDVPTLEKTALFRGGYEEAHHLVIHAKKVRSYFNATQWERDYEHAVKASKGIRDQHHLSPLEALQRVYHKRDTGERRVFLRGRAILHAHYAQPTMVDEHIAWLETNNTLFRLVSPVQGELLCFLPAPP